MKNIKKFKKVTICKLLVILMIMCSVVPGYGLVMDSSLDEAVKDTASYMYKTVSNPQVGSIGGEWAIIGLARSSYDVPEEYYQKYYTTVESYVKSLEGKLHDKKYTEYSRLIVALSSIGKNATNVGGYNLLTALGDYDKTIWQGLNGPIWALIALDSGNYEIPENKEAKTQATRDMYINRILECQLPDGGWSLFGGTLAQTSGDSVSDPDITGMALQALAKYQHRSDVKKVIEEALESMSKKQNDKGGFASWGTDNSESCVQMIVALGELGISIDDSRFVKNGNTMLDNLMTFYKKGNGFLHTLDGGGSNQMASEQAFYALVSAQRSRDGKNSLYNMNDSLKVEKTIEGIEAGSGLEGKLKEIKVKYITKPGKTFDDITGINAHKNQPAIEGLASREIINGKTQNLFGPNDTMTRAEFATIIVNALGLESKPSNIFTDVNKADWHYQYISTAYNYEIVKGKTSDKFEPNGTITRQEAAVMIARAAKLCGMDIDIDNGSVRDILAQFSDYVKSAEWAQESLAFCYNENILDQSDIDILPDKNITRSEVAQMIFNMLGVANLL